MGHHWDEYDTKGADVVEVDVSADIARARKEQERKELMKKPKAQDEFEYKVSWASGWFFFFSFSVGYGWAMRDEDVRTLTIGDRADQGRCGTTTPTYFVVTYSLFFTRRGESHTRGTPLMVSWKNGSRRTRRICVWRDRNTVSWPYPPRMQLTSRFLTRTFQTPVFVAAPGISLQLCIDITISHYKVVYF